MINEAMHKALLGQFIVWQRLALDLAIRPKFIAITDIVKSIHTPEYTTVNYHGAQHEDHPLT